MDRIIITIEEAWLHSLKTTVVNVINDIKASFLCPRMVSLSLVDTFVTYTEDLISTCCLGGALHSQFLNHIITYDWYLGIRSLPFRAPDWPQMIYHNRSQANYATDSSLIPDAGKVATQHVLIRVAVIINAALD